MQRQRPQWSAGRHDLPLGATDEAAGTVGFVELKGVDGLAGRAEPALHRFVVDAGDLTVGVQHQPLSHQARGVGQSVGCTRVRREQQKPGGADAVGGQHNQTCLLFVLHAVGIEVHRAVGAAAFVGGDLTHSTVGSQYRAVLDGGWPMGDVKGGLCAFRASRFAGAVAHALGKLADLL
jgi:hypothetical protein